MNMMRTAVLLAAMTALFMVVGLALGGKTGMMMALVFAIGTNVFAYWNSDRMALASVDAQEVDAQSAPELYNLVAELAQRAELPMPRVYVVHSDQPNAFATGRDPQHAAVAVNTGLIQMLTREEVAGVLAHELAHIKNRDTLTMTITATLAGAISSIAQFGMFFGGSERRENGLGMIGTIALSILAPIAAMVVQMAVSRSREYVADEMGGRIAGNPIWLASALEKIAGGVAAIPDQQAEAKPAMAHMFIMNPLSGSGMDNLFSTHPNTENRVAALVQQAQAMGLGVQQQQQQPPRSGWRPFPDEQTGASGSDGSFLGGQGISGGGKWGGGDQRGGPWG